jgi:sugar lactone lactonase YvrE
LISSKIENILDPVSSLGEGLLVRNSMVFWIDIDSSQLFVFKDLKVHCYDLPIQATVIFDLNGNDLIVGSMLEIGAFNILTKNYVKISSFLASGDEHKNSEHFRTNDGALMKEGLFIFGTMCRNQPHNKKGNLYIATLDQLTLIDQLYIPNSFIQLPNGDFLISDSLEKIIWKYAFKNGELMSKKIFKQFDYDVPDGGCLVDQEFLYIAMYNCSAVYILSLDGEVLDKIEVPMKHPTNCKYDIDLNKLWITSAYSKDDTSSFSGKTISVRL